MGGAAAEEEEVVGGASGGIGTHSSLCGGSRVHTPRAARTKIKRREGEGGEENGTDSSVETNNINR